MNFRSCVCGVRFFCVCRSARNSPTFRHRGRSSIVDVVIIVVSVLFFFVLFLSSSFNSCHRKYEVCTVKLLYQGIFVGIRAAIIRFSLDFNFSGCTTFFNRRHHKKYG